MSTDSDSQNLLEMKRLVAMAQKRAIAIPIFVSQQWELIDGIKFIDTKWKDETFSLVNLIEDTYAAAADRGDLQLPNDDLEIVSDALRRMLVSIDEILR